MLGVRRTKPSGGGEGGDRVAGQDRMDSQGAVLGGGHTWPEIPVGSR